MTEGITMQEWLKSLSSVSSLGDLYVLVMDVNGNPVAPRIGLLNQQLMTAASNHYQPTTPANIDDIKTPGLYSFTTGQLTGPMPFVYAQICLLEVITRFDGWVMQRLTNVDGKCAFRVCSQTTQKWTAWKVVQTVDSTYTGE